MLPWRARGKRTAQLMGNESSAGAERPKCLCRPSAAMYSVKMIISDLAGSVNQMQKERPCIGQVKRFSSRLCRRGVRVQRQGGMFEPMCSCMKKAQPTPILPSAATYATLYLLCMAQ
jgi:hypothetical protein